MLLILKLLPIAVAIAGGIAYCYKKYFSKAAQERRLYKELYLEYTSNSNTYGHRAKLWCPRDYKSNIEWYREGGECEKYAQRVLDMPQLTFMRWLIFYNNKPTCWHIIRDEEAIFADIPYYVKTIKEKNKKEKLIFIPIFWTDAEEMQKYRTWVETKYERGQAEEYTQAQAENLKKLTQYINEDIQEKRAATQEELQRLRDTINVAPLQRDTINVAPMQPVYSQDESYITTSTGEIIKIPEPVSFKQY